MIGCTHIRREGGGGMLFFPVCWEMATGIYSPCMLLSVLRVAETDVAVVE